MNALVTGAAGFIGYHVSEKLLREGFSVTGLDNLNGYYDPRLKHARLARLLQRPRFEFAQLDLAARSGMEALFERHRFELILHLGAQAGVRYSIENPHVYAESNLTGFLHILEGARRTRVKHLVYASSSSVYGGCSQNPFRTTDRCDRPLSLYAATKRANELMAHTYTHLFGIPSTGLRFFTVYGPWGRPDMAPYRFAEAIEQGQRLDIYNYGRMCRDFTYIDDIVEGVFRVATGAPCGYRLLNIGAGEPVELMDFVRALEHALGKRARRRFLPMQKGDVPATHADSEDLFRLTGFRPSISIGTGVERFIEWYREWNTTIRGSLCSLAAGAPQ